MSPVFKVILPLLILALLAICVGLGSCSMIFQMTDEWCARHPDAPTTRCIR